MSDPEWSKFKHNPGQIPRTLYHCDHCGHEWRPRNTEPGASIFCPKCGEYHSRRAGYLKPPKARVYVPQGRPVKPRRSKPLKPHKKKEYVNKGIDQFEEEDPE